MTLEQLHEYMIGIHTDRYFEYEFITNGCPRIKVISQHDEELRQSKVCLAHFMCQILNLKDDLKDLKEEIKYHLYSDPDEYYDIYLKGAI